MKTVGIIAEYNPFHRGHRYQLDYIRKELGADYIIVAMSGDFVQRGTPALLEKHKRAEMALREGADLVLELPVSVSCSSAEYFARGGVSLLDSLGVTDFLCFGSEEGNLSLFPEIAGVLADEPEDYRIFLQNNLRSGLSYPSARSRAILSYFQKHGQIVPSEKLSAFLSAPNNILGIEYCKAILTLKSQIQPVTLKRKGASYHDLCLDSVQAPSATGIRSYLLQASETEQASSELASRMETLIPESALSVFLKEISDHAFLSEDALDVLLQYRLFFESSDSLCLYPDVTPDLADRILNLRNQYQSFSQFVQLLHTKEMTVTRIRRALLHIVLQIRKIPDRVPYGRILGFQKNASPLLKEVKKRGTIPLLPKLADAGKLLNENAYALLEEDIRSSNIYEGLLCQKTGRPFTHECEKPIVIL